MSPLDWAFVVLILYPLVQVPVVLYLSRHFEIDEEDLVTPPMRAFWQGQAGGTDGGSPSSERAAGLTSLVTCSACGTANEREYRYCQHCVSRLGPGVP